MKLWAEGFYRSAAWRRCKNAYLQSVGGLCERCSTPDNPVLADIVHHRTYLTPENIGDPEVSLTWERLEALCQTCHNREHHGEREHHAERFTFDADGGLSPPPCTPRGGERIPSGEANFPAHGRA